MFTMPKPYPREFREDVIRVARNREPDVMLKTIASDFGISEDRGPQGGGNRERGPRCVQPSMAG